MNRAVDPQYQFAFITRDGRRYHRACYWDALYVFAYGQDHILAAARVVPHNSLQEALYEAFQSKQGEGVTRELLPEAVQQPLPGVQADGASDAFVDTVTALLPDVPSQLPEAVLQKTGETLEETVSQELVRQGFAQGLNSFGATETDPLFAPGEDASVLNAGSARNKALIVTSFRVHRAVKAQMRQMMQEDASEPGLVRAGDVEFDLARRLYSNPRYLAFVKRLLDTEGSYVSPVVRDFLSFYTRCLNMRLTQMGRENALDPAFMARRLESHLGQVRGKKGHHYFNYHDVTILGTVVKGDFEADADDPDRTGEGCFKLASDMDPAGVVLCETEMGVQRFLIRKFVEHTFNVHHNVRHIQYIDEAETPSPPPKRHVPDALARRLNDLAEGFEDWIGANADRVIKMGIGWVMVFLIVGLVIVVSALIKMSGG